MKFWPDRIILTATPALGVLALVCAALALEADAQAPEDPQHEILLKARTFVPSPATASMRSASARHAIVQFEDDISADSIAALEATGVEVVGYVPRNAVAASIPAGVSLEDVEGVRAVTSLLRSDKLSPYLNESLDLGYFLVDMFSDVSEAAANEVISAAGGTLVPNPYLAENTYLVGGDADVVHALAGADETNWLWNAPEAVIAGEPVYMCPGPSTSDGGEIGNFVVHDDGWDGPGQGSADLTYHFVNGTSDIAGTTEHTEIAKGITEWSNHIAVSWRETGTADKDKSFDVLFATGDHGDGFPFDGPGGTLAHAFFPSPPNSEPIAGDMHFDDDETWMVGADIDMFSVALHEAGHAIGLGHSDNSDAVMHAFYKLVTELHPDDIQGAQSIYAKSISGPIELTKPSLLNTNGNTDQGGDANVAVDTDGLHWVSVWQSNHNLRKNAGRDNDIFVAIDGDNTPSDWGSPSTLNSNADTDSGEDTAPDIATGGAGDWVVVWQSNHSFRRNGTDWDILAATSLDNGATWSDPVDVSSIARTDSGDDTNPQIASDRNGNWICVWESDHGFQRSGTDRDIMYAVSTDQGATWSSVQMLNSKAFRDTGNDSSPAIGTDRSGKWVVVWHTSEPFRKSGHDNDIAYATSTDNGATWSRQLLVNRNNQGDTGQDKHPKLATDRKGNWVCVWHSNHDLKGAGTDNDILMARSTNNGGRWGKTTRVNNNAKSDSGDDTLPQISTDTLGRWICVWETNENLEGKIGTDQDVLYSLSRSSGKSWSDPGVLNTNADRDAGNDSRPFIVNNESGKWVMAWDSDHNLGNRAEDDRDIFLVNEAEDLSGAP